MVKKKYLSIRRMSQTESKDNIIIHENEGVPLKRRLGFVSGVALIVGTIIGSGIFVSPKGVLTNTGSVGLCLIVWCICGVVSLAAALVYAELGTLIPLSGSDFSYMLKAYGSFPAFMYTWTQLFIFPGAQVIKGLTVAQYLGKAVFDDCGPTDATLKLIAAVVILTSGITNCISVRLAASVQIIFTILKLIGLATIIGGGILMLSRGTVGSLPTGFEGSVDNPTSIATAIYSGLWAFGGWDQLNFVTEELKNPRRNLPLCIITSVLLVLVVYLMVNVSYFTVLTKEEFVSSWAVAATWAEYVLPGAVVIIPITVACSVYGSMNGSGLIVGRILFATARVQLFPECLSYLNVNTNIPVPSTILISIFAFALILPSDIKSLLNMLGFLRWFFYGLGMIAHIVLRYRMKDVDRPLKVPIVVSVVVLAFSIYLVVAPFLEPVKIEFWYAVGFLVLGAILYVPFAFFKLGLPGMDYINTFVQMMTQSAPTQEIAI
ncbi:b(0,+)-type amino acid transporter 1-like [Mytilus edulis]|uniref:b(0,+)-type amino acid transporter 1-like n=1 Tax=Mytilus edulis TaxID=6550 RepID=UPI0039EF2459